MIAGGHFRLEADIDDKDGQTLLFWYPAVTAADCATHARLFFGSPDLGLDTAAFGNFTLTPDAAMHDALERDYAAMSGMIFGDIPSLDTVLASVVALQDAINATAPRPT